MVPALAFRLSHEWDNWNLYQVGRELAVSVEYLLIYFGQKPNQAKIRLMYQNLPIHNLKDLAIKGNDLIQQFDYPKGPWINQVLRGMEREVIEKNLPNEQEALLNFAQIFMEEEPHG